MSVLILVAIALVFVGLFLGLAAFGGLAGESTGLNRSIGVIRALTDAPDEMKTELDAPFAERVLFPLLSRVQGIGRRLTPADASDRIRAKLDKAGNPSGWTVERVSAGKVMGFAAGTVLALLLSLLLNLSFLPTLGFVMVAAVIGYLAPDFYLYQRAYDRADQMQRALADAIDLLTISVESGLGFDAAVQQVARNTEGPLADEFARLLQEMQIGRGRTESLRSLAERTNLPDLRAFVSAMVQADAFGIPVGQVLRVQSSEIRVKKRQWAEEMAQKVPVKILLPLIFCILPCLFIAVLGPAAITIYHAFAGRLT